MKPEVYSQELKFSTTENKQLVDLTREIEKIVSETGVQEGQCLIYAPHATGAIIIQENETGLKTDMLETLARLIPRQNNYKHDRIDDNAHSHLYSAMLSPCQTIPIIHGTLALGTWQSIFFVESDGPRATRHVLVQVMGQK